MDNSDEFKWMCLTESLGCWNLSPVVYTKWKSRRKVQTEILAIRFHQGTTNLGIQKIFYL